MSANPVTDALLFIERYGVAAEKITHRPPGHRCFFCKQRVYYVQNAAGEIFTVTHQGKRSCPLRAHRTSSKPRPPKRRGKK